MKKAFFVTSLLFLFGVTLLLGGLGVEVDFVQYFGVFVGLVFLVSTYLLEGKLEFPPTFSIYLVFLLLFALGGFWSLSTIKTIKTLALFLSGGLFWLSFYNLDLKKSHIKVDELILGLGIVFAALFFYYAFIGESAVKWRSLFLPYAPSLNHNNIGDFWVVPLLFVSYRLLKKPEGIFYWLFIPLGIYLLFASRSRSALVALAIGTIYLVRDRLRKKRYKVLFLSFSVLSVAIFLLLSLEKTTLFTRPYYFQAFSSIFRNPFGVGMGNFHEISRDASYHLFGFSEHSIVVHNLVLEVLVGMGVFGLTFIYWLYEIFLDVWKYKKTMAILYGASFLALAGNFFFHLTYFVPTMLWLWFFFLGLFQKEAA